MQAALDEKQATAVTGTKSKKRPLFCIYAQ